jgi:putative membrane protein
MIIKGRPSWIRLVFAVKGSGLNVTGPRIAVVTAVAIVITLFDALLKERFDLRIFQLTSTPFSLIGVALGIFLSFRNNAAYDRFWEGRKLWGALVNVSRSLTRQALTLIVLSKNAARSLYETEEDEAALASFRRDFVYRIIAYVHSLRHHLRQTDPLPELAGLLPAEEIELLRGQKNIPVAQIQTLGNRIRWAWQQGWISDMHVPIFESSLTEITSIQGACERIKNTPIPFAYTVFIHRIVAAYCLFLPLGIVGDIHYMTPLVVLLISYAFFGLDELGDEIEDPFGTDLNDLPLHALSRAIEINLRQLLDEKEVPPFLEPVGGVLL